MKFVTQSYYEILDVPPDAGEDQIRKAYRQARQTFQPDSMAIYSLYAPEESEAIAAKIDEAFQILTDRERRRRYDRFQDFRQLGEAAPAEPAVFYERVRESLVSPAATGLAGAAFGFASRGASAFADPEAARSSGDHAARPVPAVDLVDELDTRFAPEPGTRVHPAAMPRVPFAAADALLTDGGDAEVPAGSESAWSDGSSAAAPATAQPQDPGPVANDADRASPARNRGLRGWTRDAMSRIKALGAAVEPLKMDPIPADRLSALEDELGASGALLRQVWELRGVDLQAISDRTKISVLYLRFIEEESFSDLPAPIYLRGFLGQLARLLELDEQRTVEGYMARQRAARG